MAKKVHRFDAKRKTPAKGKPPVKAKKAKVAKPAKAKKPARRGPRSQALPGMEQVRHQKLDGYGEDAGEGLDKINEGTEQVNDARNAAMVYMRANGIDRYTAAGVVFTYSHGVEKVSVKRVKERGDNKAEPSDVGNDEPEGSDENADAPEGDAGEGGKV